MMVAVPPGPQALEAPARPPSSARSPRTSSPTPPPGQRRGSPSPDRPSRRPRRGWRPARLAVGELACDDVDGDDHARRPRCARPGWRPARRRRRRTPPPSSPASTRAVLSDRADAGRHAAADQRARGRAACRRGSSRARSRAPASSRRRLEQVRELVHRRAVPGELRRLGASRAPAGVWQRCVRPVRQYSQWPQKTDRHAMT